MEFWTSGITLLRTIVTLLGAASIIGGLIEVGRSQSENNPSVRNIGFAMFIGGAIIIAVGQTLVPKLESMITLS